MFCNHPANTGTAFTEHLVAVLQPQMIFRHQNGLYLIVPDQVSKPLPMYKALVKAATYGLEVPEFYLYERSKVCAGLEEGMLYSLIFVASNLVYQNGKSVLPQPLYQRLAEVRQQKRQLFEDAFSRSLSFSQGARRYCLDGVYDIAAYMLHQSIELLLRSLIIAVTGQEMKTHCIKKNWRPAGYLPRNW